MMSIEIIPIGMSFVYGFDYHDQWYTQLKPAIGYYGFGRGTVDWSVVNLNFAVEQRYYYNMLKRKGKEKRTDYK
jgi:hypothetical protein